MKEGLDSTGELYFTWWLKDLQDASILNNFEKGRTFDLTSSFNINYLKELKKATKEVSQNILAEHKYSPDFELHFDHKHSEFDKIVYLYDKRVLKKDKWNKQPLFSINDCTIPLVVEIKPIFDKNNMTRLFRLNQKWMMDKYSMYINEIEVTRLFSETFTPERYLYTDSGMTKRQINKWQPVSLKHYLNNYK